MDDNSAITAPGAGQANGVRVCGCFHCMLSLDAVNQCWELTKHDVNCENTYELVDQEECGGECAV